MIQSMLKEIELKSGWNKEEVETIYFGGGTPSLLSGSELKRFLDHIHSYYKVSSEAEITLELNPDDASEEKLGEWKTSGINRLSIGIQSFHEEDLIRMNRAHSADEARSVVPMAKSVGFENISIDLMFGLPFQSVLEWEKNLEEAILLNVPHISCYNLTVEEKTALKHKIAMKEWPDVEEKTSAELFQITQGKLNAAGIEQYEISNYARNGFESKHNRSYWYQRNYLGFGPSAHSYIDGRRFGNIAHNQKYIQVLDKQTSKYYEEEVLNQSDLFNEFLLTRLRLIEGFSIEVAKNDFSKEWESIQEVLNQQIKKGYIKIENEWVKLTNEGMLLADDITAQLFILD
jgi:oxygen-independent coproporphyrinogen-3 oxidase